MEGAKTLRCVTVSPEFNDLKRFLLATPNTIWGLLMYLLSAVDPELMGKAISGLEEVGLHGSSLTASQVQELFAQMNQGTKLKVFDVGRNNLAAVDPELMGKAVSGLEKVYLHRSALTAPQVQELIAQMNQGTTLKVFNLWGNNLSSVEPGLMGKAISGMEKVDLYDTFLTAPQIQQLFAQMNQGTKLMDLELSENDLSSLDPEVLTRAVHRLEVVRLADTNLTSEQYNRIVSGGDQQSKLKRLLLWDPNRSDNVTISFSRGSRIRGSGDHVLYAPERGPSLLDFLLVLTAFLATVFAAYYSIS